MATMEDLNKTQIVLLTLLVSFVTSIATGIITVSLLQEAPESVTQTINRVVERTIEVAAPDDTPSTTIPTVKEVTVVKEEDAIIGSIEQATNALVRIKSPVNADGTGGGFYAAGVFVSKDGYIVSDKRELIKGGIYSVTLSDGTTLPATFVKTSDEDHLTLFKVKTDENRSSFPFVSLSKGDLKLGQSVISVGGREKNSVAVGRVLSFNSHTEKDNKGNDMRIIHSVVTDIDGETFGAPLLNLSGELVGIKSSNEDLTITKGLYTSIIPIRSIIERN